MSLKKKENMFLVNTNGKSYAGSPITPFNLNLSDIERSDMIIQFERFDLVKELSSAIC